MSTGKGAARYAIVILYGDMEQVFYVGSVGTSRARVKAMGQTFGVLEGKTWEVLALTTVRRMYPEAWRRYQRANS